MKYAQQKHLVITMSITFKCRFLFDRDCWAAWNSLPHSLQRNRGTPLLMGDSSWKYLAVQEVFRLMIKSSLQTAEDKKKCQCQKNKSLAG